MAGLFDFNSSAEANGAVSFLYAGGGNLGADLSAQFQFEVVFTIFDFAGNAPLPVTITLDDGSNTAMGTAALVAAGSQTLVIPFASFAGIGSIDLSSIDSIRVDLDAGEGVDMRISEIRTAIPAPASLAVLGLAALTARRRRRSSLFPALNPRQQAG